MKARDIVSKSRGLLGYTSAEDDRLNAMALPSVNQIYSDLFYMNHSEGFTPAKDINSDITLPEMVLNDVMPYGVAMMLAQNEGSTDNQSFFAALYNQKRAKCTSIGGQIVDDIPGVYDE